MARKEILIILGICIMVVLLFIVAFFLFNKGIEKNPYVSLNNLVRINVEIADTPAEWERGLMFRESLPKNLGMLFIFPDSAVRTFWMKNVLIPLDIYFIDAEGIIVKIEKRLPPCQADPCLTYSSESPVKYVLEVNGGFSEEYMIKRWNKVKFYNIFNESSSG